MKFSNTILTLLIALICSSAMAKPKVNEWTSLGSYTNRDSVATISVDFNLPSYNGDDVSLPLRYVKTMGLGKEATINYLFAVTSKTDCYKGEGKLYLYDNEESKVHKFIFKLSTKDWIATVAKAVCSMIN